MADEIVGTSIYLLAGMSAELLVENEFANPGPVIHKGVERVLLRGFLVDNEDVGILDVTDIPEEEGTKVRYKHLKAMNNSIWFYSMKGNPYERGLVNVVAVPIHDHSSIVQGGPAYGTYFSDDMIVEKEDSTS